MRISLWWSFLLCLPAFPLGVAAHNWWAHQPTKLCVVADVLPSVADGFLEVPIGLADRQKWEGNTP